MVAEAHSGADVGAELGQIRAALRRLAADNDEVRSVVVPSRIKTSLREKKRRRGRSCRETLPLPHEHVEFESAFTRAPSERRARLEDLADTYTTALQELRARDDAAHALLIVRLEALYTAVLRELRYIAVSSDSGSRL